MVKMKYKVIRLTKALPHGRKPAEGTARRVSEADIVIDKDGTVIKDRFGQADRKATQEELDKAVWL